MDRRPLYKLFSDNVAFSPGSGNTGLWYNKFCDQWDISSSFSELKKLDWISGVSKNKIGNKELLEEASLRQSRFVNASRGKLGIFKTTSRFVSGLGINHPVENGFAWHHTLGVPFLPGSSVKGMVRAWVEEKEISEEISEQLRDEVFGTSNHIGEIIFCDAFPLEPVQLEAEVMTPHYGGWTSPSKPPGDWLDPVPIPFLTVAKNSHFVFSIVPRKQSMQKKYDQIDAVFGWLSSALFDSGAGAKTAIGYGQFSISSQKTESLRNRVEKQDNIREEELRKLALQSTPAGRWCLELEGKSEREILDIVRIHLQKEPIEDPSEAFAFAEAIRATGLLEYWRKGNSREAKIGVSAKKIKERAVLVKKLIESLSSRVS